MNPRAAEANVPDGREPDPTALAGGAVAWKLGQALVETRAPLAIERYHRDALPLAAIATVGDYMPLTVENRAIVRAGFDRLAQCELAGLDTLIDHCGVSELQDLRWSLAPLLNAAQEAEDGSFMHEVVLEADSDRIERLERYRADRQAERSERREHLEAQVADQVDADPGPVLHVDVDQYVGGGPLSNIAESWERPAIAYRETDDGFRGGGRTAGTVNLLDLYEGCDELLAERWGHPGAAGFRVQDHDRTTVKRALTTTASQQYDPEELRPTLEVDGVLAPETLNERVPKELADLRPFGPDNDEPLFLVRGLRVEAREWFGDGDTHCRLQSDSVDAICWNGHEVLEALALPAKLDVVGTLGRDDYTGRPTVTVEDCRPSTDCGT